MKVDDALNLDLEHARVLYLDDESKFLNDLKRTFHKKKIELTTTKSITQAMERVRNEEFDVFVCDYMLKHIDANRTGVDLFQEVRRNRWASSTMLVLYSAWTESLTRDQKRWLIENGVRIYSKNDTNVVMLANLKKQYRRFRSEQIEGESNDQHSKIEALKLELGGNPKAYVMDHLRKVSNPEIVINLPGTDGLSVKQLMHEVSVESESGVQYMMECLKSVVFLGNKKK